MPAVPGGSSLFALVCGVEQGIWNLPGEVGTAAIEWRGPEPQFWRRFLCHSDSFEETS